MDMLRWNFDQNTKVRLKKIHLEIVYATCWTFCPGLNMLKTIGRQDISVHHIRQPISQFVYDVIYMNIGMKFITNRLSFASPANSEETRFLLYGSWACETEQMITQWNIKSTWYTLKYVWDGMALVLITMNICFMHLPQPTLPVPPGKLFVTINGMQNLGRNDSFDCSKIMWDFLIFSTDYIDIKCHFGTHINSIQLIDNLTKKIS